MAGAGRAAHRPGADAQERGPDAVAPGARRAGGGAGAGLRGLALLPPLWGIPLAAYVSVGVLLVGGIALLPWLVQGVLALAMPLARRGPLWLLVLARAQRMRASAAVAVGGWWRRSAWRWRSP